MVGLYLEVFLPFFIVVVARNGSIHPGGKGMEHQRSYRVSCMVEILGAFPSIRSFKAHSLPTRKISVASEEIFEAR